MPLWEDIWRMTQSDTDSDRTKNTIASPTQNDLYGYTHTVDPTSNVMTVTDPSGKVVTDPATLDKYTQRVQEGWADKPYQPITGKQAHFNPAIANQVNDENFKAFNEGNQATIGRNIWEKNAYQPNQSQFPGMTGDQAYANTLVAPSTRNQWGKDTSYGATGAPSLIGGMDASNDVNNAKLMLQNSQGALGRNNVINASLDADAANSLSKETNVEPLVIQHTINTLRSSLNADPTEAQILQAVNATKLATAKQAETDIPINTGTQRLQDIGQNYLSQHMPDEMATTPFMNRVTADGVVPSGGVLGTGYRSPTQVQMAALNRGLGPISTQATPSGTTYVRPVKTQDGLVSPITGTGYGPEKLQERVDKHNDAVDAQHDAKQATIASQISHLKAIQKQLQAEHTRSGILPMMGNNLVGNMHSVLDPVGHAIGKGYNKIANSLVGE